MNPMTNIKNVIKLSEQELHSHGKSSWHDQYRDSAWLFVGGLPYDLTEGDIICIFSQYGEVVNINLIRAKDTGKSKGYCFLCYEDQRSTVLAVDNFNGIKILNRTIRVDHVSEYKIPKENRKTDEETKKLYQEGCAPKAQPIIERPKTPPQDFRETIADQIENDIKLPQRLPIYPIKQEPGVVVKKEKKEKKKKRKKEKKSKKSKKSKRKLSDSGSDSSSSSEDEESEEEPVKIKKEKKDRSRSRSPSKSKHDRDKKIYRRDRSMSRSKERQSSSKSNKRRSRSRSPRRR